MNNTISVQDMLSGESSGDFAEFAKYGSTISWVSFLMSSRVTSTPWIPTSQGHTPQTHPTTTLSPTFNSANDSTLAKEAIFMFDNSLPEYNDTDNISDYNTLVSYVQLQINGTFSNGSDEGVGVNSSVTTGPFVYDADYDDLTNASSRVDEAASDSNTEHITDDENVPVKTGHFSSRYQYTDKSENIATIYTTVPHNSVVSDTPKPNIVYKEAESTMGPLLKVLEPTTMRILEQKLIKDELKQAGK